MPLPEEIWLPQIEKAQTVAKVMSLLSAGNEGADHLAAWLRGRGSLPPLGAEEPYVWLYRGLVLSGHTDLGSRLVKAAVALLRRTPAVERPHKLYSVFGGD